MAASESQSQCKLCHNWQPSRDFLIPGRMTENFRVYPDGRREPFMVQDYYTHPNCARCREMLEAHGIPQKSPWL